MIPLSDLYNWLNREDTSHLTNKSKFSIWQINDPKLPDSQKDTMIEALVNSTRASQDDCEYAEVLVFAGKTQGDRRKFCEAQFFLNHAISRYSSMNETFRGAVAKIMLSNIQWMTGDNNSAYASFRTARDVLEKIAREKRQAMLDKTHHLPGLEKDVVWYSNNIDLLNDTWIEQPEEAYSWLNLFQESFLSSAAKQLRDAIGSKLATRDFIRAYQELAALQDMVKGSLEPREKAEVYAFSGLTYFQMGNAREAEKYLRSAASLFPPDRHHQTMVRWMQAMVVAKDTYRMSEAIRIANDVVRCLEGLRLSSDHSNHSKECTWYETQANNTRRVIKKLTERM
jgi:tetratricopeptide (TPR) repeat protein